MSQPPSATAAKRPHRPPAAIAACLAALALCTWADLASKDWAAQRLSQAQTSTPPLCVPVAVAGSSQKFTQQQRDSLPPIVVIKGYAEFSYAENCGAAFSMLVGSPSWVRTALFAPAAIAATLGLIWLFITGYGGQLFAFSVPLIASGALGNLIDRFRLGYVVDFIRLHNRDGFSWPTFNVADSTITVGVVLLLIEGFLAPRKQVVSSATQAPDPAESTGR